MISFIIPAHNEERFLPKTLEAIAASTGALGDAHEVIVVADACTDATEAIARERGARVIVVDHRQIAPTRNAGARAASGDVFFFIDADTQPNAEAVRACLDAVRDGAIGGGCLFRFDRPLPLWGRIIFPPAMFLSRRLKIVGGCFVFCTRAGFECVGGFDETLFAAEEIQFIRALKRVGRVVVPRPTVVTSGRKLSVIGPVEVLRMIGVALVNGRRLLRSRDKLDIFYGERAEAARRIS